MTLSIAVAAKGICDPAAFVEALRREHIPEKSGVDVHIAHDEDWPLESSDMDECIKLHKCPVGTSILRLWGTAIASSEGEYVAALDVLAPPAAGWMNSVEQHIREKVPLFFGPVESGWRKNDSGITGYLAEYAQFSKPLSGTLNEVPGSNVVCHRSLLDDQAELLSSGFFKTFMVWRLEQELNLKPLQFDDMSVTYQKPFSYVHYMGRRYMHGRCFGATRHDNAGQPARVFCILSTFVLPLVRMWRIFRVVRGHSDLRYAFFRFFHLLVQSEVAWSYGELVGYINRNRSVCAQLD